MSKKSLAAALLAVSLSVPAFAADPDRTSRQPRLRDAPAASRIIKALKKFMVGVLDGAEITIPKP